MNKVAVLIGSETDKPIIMAADPYFNYFGINWELHVLSAHRNPDEVAIFARDAKENGYSILIGAAGMAAHLAGVLKAHTILPVIGIPLPGGIQDGLDSLMSTLQMPKGVPVATVTVGKAGAINAAVLSAEILGLQDDSISEKLKSFKSSGCKL